MPLEKAACFLLHKTIFFKTGKNMPQEKPLRHMRNLTYLVADSNPITRRITCDLLRQSGFTYIETATDAADIRLALRASPARHDMLIVNFDLAKSSGSPLLTELKENSNRTPVLMTTSGKNPADPHLALQAGATATLKWPLTPDILAGKIREICMQRDIPVTGGALQKAPVAYFNPATESPVAVFLGHYRHDDGSRSCIAGTSRQDNLSGSQMQTLCDQLRQEFSPLNSAAPLFKRIEGMNAVMFRLPAAVQAPARFGHILRPPCAPPARNKTATL